MALSRIPFLGKLYDRPTPRDENRKAQFGRQRFVVRETSAQMVCSVHCSVACQPRPSMPLILLQKELALHKNSDILHPPTERPRNILKPSCGLAAFAIFLSVLVSITTTIGDFTIEFGPWANSTIGMRLFTDKFDDFDRPCFPHTAEIGRLRMEASFGTWSPSVGDIDYANVAKGAKSIPALTSALYSPSIHFDITRLDKTFWKSFSPKPSIHPPEMALSGSTSPGQCWAFAGHTGQLGIQLSEPIRVTSFTVEHTRNSSLMESAPKAVILWGLILKDSDDIRPKSSSHENRPINTLWPQFGAIHHGIPLASVTFDAIQGPPRQTFPVRCRETSRPFDSLVAQFVGNWGHPYFTCLYRFEIHGERVRYSG